MPFVRRDKEKLEYHDILNDILKRLIFLENENLLLMKNHKDLQSRCDFLQKQMRLHEESTRAELEIIEQNFKEMDAVGLTASII